MFSLNFNQVEDSVTIKANIEANEENLETRPVNFLQNNSQITFQHQNPQTNQTHPSNNSNCILTTNSLNLSKDTCSYINEFSSNGKKGVKKEVELERDPLIF